jgi:hypothetical protein
MPALKLFVSHSSRLDDVPHRHTDNDANWRLLREVCDELKARYGDTIRILVDKDGLIAGDDWNRELNLWLAECQAAVILVSRRAMDKSDWVAKEAAILGWRKALDPEFTLIPVTIEGESQPSDLAQAFWGSLEMGRIQCLHAERSAGKIVAGIAARLAKDGTLIGGCGLTPLDLLRDAIAHMLVGSQSPNALDAALDALDPEDEDPPDAGLPHPKQCGQRLARRLLRSSVDDIWACFQVFRHLLCYAAPPIPFEQAKWLLKLVRALWVNPGAAAFLPSPVAGRPALALCGAYVSVPGPSAGSTAYTFERYLDRAWSYPEEPPLVVSLARPDTPAEQVWGMIVDRVLPGHPNPTSPGAKKVLSRRTIVLFAPASGDQGGPPDGQRLQELTGLAGSVGKLVLVFASCESADALPDGMRAVEPLLDPGIEDEAYNAEYDEITHVQQIYDRQP